MIMEEKLERNGELEKSQTSLPAEHADAESLPVIDPAEEAKLIRKLDFYIIPLTMLLYLFSFLDRYALFEAKQ
jgi:hypothetical protein